MGDEHEQSEEADLFKTFKDDAHLEKKIESHRNKVRKQQLEKEIEELNEQAITA